MNIILKDVLYNYDIRCNKLGDLDIDSIIIENNGNLESKYFKDEVLHELRSCSKLLVAMAVGIVIENKILINGEPLTLNTKVFPLIEKYVNITNKNNLEKLNEWTVKNLLTHTTGYESQMFSERFLKDVDKSEVLDYALNYNIPYEVGARYAYNNVEPFMFSVIFKECLGIGLDEFVDEYIFKKLDIKEYKWNSYGRYCMAATGLYLKHTDFHKIASLLLNDGKYNNEQIISKHWIDEMIKLQIETPDNYKPERVLPKVGGGYFTFISRDGYVFRDGTNGQYIILNKDKKLLITIMASEPEMKNVTEILRGIL